jgi:hypothetical protein
MSDSAEHAVRSEQKEDGYSKMEKIEFAPLFPIDNPENEERQKNRVAYKADWQVGRGRSAGDREWDAIET